jgi:phospholipase C
VNRLTRRTFLGATAALSAAALAACSPAKKKSAAASSSAKAVESTAAPGARTGTIKDVKHVVILMQENRSFDHYFGALAGVRGLADKQQLRFANGTSIFDQPDPSRGSTGTLSPWRFDTTKVDGQDAADLDHSWPKTHKAWNQGAWNQWIAAKTEQTMGYFTRTDIPWQYALADAFTVCDAYYCSVQGPTIPNRLYLWTGTIDPSGRAGGPVIDNPADYKPVYSWTTYPERLQEAGVSWQVYANDEVGDSAGQDGWVGDYGDNPLWLFQAYHDALNSSDAKQQQLASRASLRKTWKPDSGQGQNVDHVLEQFIGDCADGTLPTVSWVVAPYLYSEHPRARPVDGANYVGRVLKALWDNPALWESTAVFVNYDENDGYFDHALPPFPPTGTAGEYIDDLPIGLGPRVPMLVVSPWSRGGWVNSQVFDHTSVLRFLETLTGVAEPNITAWRRSVAGDLTSCFDFASFDPSVPALPDITKLLSQAKTERNLAAPSAPGTGAQLAPVVETGSRKYRALPYQLNANVTVDRSAGTAKIAITNAGRAAAAVSVYPNVAGKPLVATPLVVPGHGQASYDVGLTAATGQYDVSIYGPNGFVRRFVGAVVAAGENSVGVPSVQATLAGSTLSLLLRNDGGADLRFSLSPNDFAGQLQTVAVSAGATQTVAWPTTDGWYDLSVDANGANGANPATAFSYRYAGRIEAG